MEDVRTYQIQIGGQVAESEIAAFSPPGWKMEPVEVCCSMLTVQTDQSGLVGLIRHLHGLGLELISIIQVGAGSPRPTPIIQITEGGETPPLPKGQFH